MTYSISNEVTNGGLMQVWLGADVSSWPGLTNNTVRPSESDLSYTAVSGSNTRKYKSHGYTVSNGNYAEEDWARTFTFSGWTEYKSTSEFTDATKNSSFDNIYASQSVIGRTLLPEAGTLSYTLKPQYEYNLPKASTYASHSSWDQPDPASAATITDSTKVTVHYFITDASGNRREIEKKIDLDSFVRDRKSVV